MQVEYIGHYGDDLLVVNCARVSFSKWHEQFEGSDEKLLWYLARENHFMPFCHPHITLRITAPIFVARQCQKHQIGFAWSEESRRYIDNPPSFFTPSGWRSRPEGNIKQGSGDKILDLVPFGQEMISIKEEYQDHLMNAEDFYHFLIKTGVAPEQARMVLPQSTEVTWIWTGSLAAFARAYKLRADSHAQKEIQDLAKMWDEVISPLFPISWKALTDV